MKDTSIIARRLADGHVQYGWSGNGGYHKNLGKLLVFWRDEPDNNLIEYLFSIGQFAQLGLPHSEETDYFNYNTTIPIGKPHYLGTSEREIFSKLSLIEHGYFYDLDQQWYYILPGAFRIKIPLRLVDNNLDNFYHAFDFYNDISEKILTYIFFEYPKTDLEFKALLSKINIKEVFEEINSDKYPLVYFRLNYTALANYFDEWIVIKANDSYTAVESIIMMKWLGVHIETIYWDN